MFRPYKLKSTAGFGFLVPGSFSSVGFSGKEGFGFKALRVQGFVFRVEGLQGLRLPRVNVPRNPEPQILRLYNLYPKP